jgi:hypothetical protein
LVSETVASVFIAVSMSHCETIVAWKLYVTKCCRQPFLPEQSSVPFFFGCFITESWSPCVMNWCPFPEVIIKTWQTLRHVICCLFRESILSFIGFSTKVHACLRVQSWIRSSKIQSVSEDSVSFIFYECTLVSEHYSFHPHNVNRDYTEPTSSLVIHNWSFFLLHPLYSF